MRGWSSVCADLSLRGVRRCRCWNAEGERRDVQLVTSSRTMKAKWDVVGWGMSAQRDERT